MHLLLTLSCLMGTILSTMPHESSYQGPKEPKVAIDGFVNGYYTFLGRQFPVFFDKAHNAFNGIETANQQTGIHSPQPHSDLHSEEITGSSLSTNHQQAGISKETAAFAHQQENLKHNSPGLNSVPGSSGSESEVFGHGHIHLNPIADKNVEEVFHFGNNHAGRVMETGKIGFLKNMGSLNSHQANLYSETSSPYANKLIEEKIIGVLPILEVTSLRGYPKGGFSQNKQGAFGIPIGMNQVGGQLTRKGAGETSSSIGLDSNIYTGNQNAFNTGAKYGEFSKFNQANINGGTINLKETETAVPYPKYGTTEQASYFNSGSKQNQVLSRNIGQKNYEGSSQIRFTNQVPGGAVTQKIVENTFVDYPISYTSQLGYMDNRLHGNQGLKDHDLHLVDTNYDSYPLRIGQANSAWNKMDRNQDNADQNLYISGNGFDSYTSTGQVNSAGTKLSDRSVAEKFKHDSLLCKLNHHHIMEPLLDSCGNIVGVTGQEKSSLNPIVQENMREVFTERKRYPADGVQQESVGVKINYEGGHQIKFTNQINNQNIYRDGAEIGSPSEKVYHGEWQVDSRRIPNAFPEYETMGNSNLNQKMTTQNLYSEKAGSSISPGIRIVRPAESGTAQVGIEIENGGAGSRIPAGIGLVRPTEAATAQEGIEIADVDSSHFTNKNIYPDGADYRTVHYGEEQVDSGRGASPSQGMSYTFPQYETMGGSTMNQENANRNQFSGKAGSSISSEIKIARPTETARPQKGIEISGVDSTYFRNENIHPNGAEYGTVHYGEGQVDSGIGVSSSQGIPNTIPGYETMWGGMNLNQDLTNQNLNTGGYLLSDSNQRLLFQGGMNGKYPIQYRLTSQYPLWKTLNYFSENRPTAKNQPQYGPNSQYLLQDGINGQYPLQSGFNTQYPPQNGLNSQYSPQGIISVQYPSQVGFNSQYPLQNGLNIQYPSQGGLNVQYSLLYGQYGQYPIENGKYLHSMLDKELSEGNQGLTSLSSRIKQDGSDHDISIEKVEPKLKVTDTTISETETEMSDVTSESGNDHDEAELISIGNTIKTVDETPGINGKTSQEYVSQIKANETSESNNESLKFQTKETTQVTADSQTIKFTIRLPPKVITTKTITSLEKHTGDDPMLDENTIKTRQPEEKKGIQIKIDSPSFSSNQEGGVSPVLDLSPRFGLEESSKPVDPSQSSEHNIAEIETSNSSSPTVGLGGKIESGRINIESVEDLMNSQDFGNNLANKQENNGILGIGVDSAIKLHESVTHQTSVVSSADNGGKLNNHNDEHVKIGVTKGTDVSAGVKTTADGSSEVSKNIIGRDSAHVLNLHYSKTDTDGYTGGIDEHMRRSNEHGVIQVPGGGFNGLSVNNEVVYLSPGHGGVMENIIDLSKSKHNVDSTYGMGLNSILDPGNNKGLGVHIKYDGPNVYGTGNLNSMKDHEMRIEDGINFHSGLNFGHGISRTG